MNDALEFLHSLVSGAPDCDPYDVDDPTDLHLGNEDEAREMGEEHARWEIAQGAKKILEDIGAW